MRLSALVLIRPPDALEHRRVVEAADAREHLVHGVVQRFGLLERATHLLAAHHVVEDAELASEVLQFR